MSEEKSKLETAEARAIEAEANMKQAAQIGKELLEKLTESESAKNELEQNIHSLKFDLTSVRANEKALYEEINDLNQRLVDAENSSKSVQILKKELEDAKLSFEKKEEDYISTIKESKTNLEEVTMKLAEKESALLLPNSPNVSVLDPEAVAVLQEEAEFLREQIKTSRDEILELKNQNEEFEFATQSLRMEVSELKQHIEEKDDELSSYRESAMQANEELKLKLDIENELPEADVAPKGNSLFSEVEDRRHLAEEKLKRCEIKLEKYKISYDQKVSEMHKLRMQNIHLLKLGSNASGKCEQVQVERLQELLEAEKSKNRILSDQISSNSAGSEKPSTKNQNQNELMDQLKKYMRQSLEDSDKLSELTKLSGNLERQLSKLKAENATLKIRLSDLKTQTKTPSTSSLPAPKEGKQSEEKIEQIFFNNENKMEEKSAIDLSSNNMVSLLNSKENIPDEVLFSKPQKEIKPKKSVAFVGVDEKDTPTDEEGPRPKKEKKTRIPKTHNQVINADEESAKMEEQCKQQ